MSKTPKQYGYRMPAEWEPQEGIWLTWPADTRLWPGHFQKIPAKFAEIVAAISRFEKVHINGVDHLHDDILILLTKAGAYLERTQLFDHPSNDVWCRDHGPIFVKNDTLQRIAVTDWQFDGWGGKYQPCNLDNYIPTRVASAMGLPRFAFNQVLEGGSIDVNGAGDLMTTESVLLNSNRDFNPNVGLIESTLAEGLGVERVLWLPYGLSGDDTDGHIDNVARFFREDGILYAMEDDPEDPNHASLTANLERLQAYGGPNGQPFTLMPMPMPDPIESDGKRLTASYLNFLVVNGAVLLPTFGQPHKDRQAAGILGSCFPGREVIPIDCKDLLLEGGALHCLTQQQPAVNRAVQATT